MSDEQEYQISYWIDGLIAPDEKMVINDNLLVEGVPNKEATCVYFKVKKKKAEDIRNIETQVGKTLSEILQIYGLVSNRYVEVPNGWGSGPITDREPFGKMEHIHAVLTTKMNAKSKENYKPLIQKTLSKYDSIIDVFKNKNKAFLRNAIDYYNRALNDDKIEEQLIDLMISLESLFSNEFSELSLRYSLRIAFLLGTNEKRSEIVKLVKKLYNKRSVIVHGTCEVDVEFEDVHRFQKLIREAIKILVHIKLNKQTILELLDEAVYSPEKKGELDKVVQEAVKDW